MPHIVFVDANESCLGTIRHVLDRGHRVTFIRATSYEFYPRNALLRSVLDSVHRLIEVDLTADADVVTDLLREVREQEPVDAVVGQMESAVEAAAVACERLGMAFTSARGVIDSRRKDRTRRRLDEEGVPSARYGVAHTVEEALRAAAGIGYPVVLKPISGMASMYASRADDPAQAEVAAERIVRAGPEVPSQLRHMFDRGILVEEYIRGELVSAEVGTLAGRFYRFMVSGRALSEANECVELGAEMPANLTPEQEAACFDYSEDVCRALGLDLGIFHLEIMMSEDRGPVLVEANPRLMGGVMTTIYEKVTGADITDALVDLHLGRPLAEPLPQARGCVTVRKLLPARAGALRDDLDLGWVGGEAAVVHMSDYALEPGGEVDRLQLIGRYLVWGEDWAAATATADRLLGRFEAALGLPLVQAAPAPLIMTTAPPMVAP